MILAALDPGLTGALALFDARGFLSVHDLPVHTFTIGKKTRTELDIASLRRLLLAQQIDHVVIEKVSSMPRQGVASTFKFGFTAGGIYGLIIGLQLPVSYLTPQQWQKTAGVGPSPDAARRRAAELYPLAAEQLTLKKHAGRADAILIGHAGLQLLRYKEAA